MTTSLMPENLRGRVFGISGSLSVVAIPISTPVGAWLADLLGVVPLFVSGGVYILAVAVVSWANPQVRGVRI